MSLQSPSEPSGSNYPSPDPPIEVVSQHYQAPSTPSPPPFSLKRKLMCSTVVQTRAILRKFVFNIKRNMAYTLCRVVLFPGFVFLGSAFISTREQMSIFALDYIGTILRLMVGLDVWYSIDYIATERANGMESLMRSMGLRKSAWYFGNILGLGFLALPKIAIVCLLTIYLTPDTKISFLMTVSVFILFFCQLIGVVFAVSSAFRNPSVVFLFGMLVLIDSSCHAAAREVLTDWTTSPHPKILFLTHISPFETLQMFADSYIDCNNSCTFGVGKRQHIHVPTSYTITSAAYWTLIMFAFSLIADLFFRCSSGIERHGVFYPLCFLYRTLFKRKPQDEHEESAAFLEEPQTDEFELGITVKQIYKKFNNLPALNNVNFNIYKDQTTVLVGNNMAGKTTLLDVIQGKVIPDYGSVECENRKIGISPQYPILEPLMSVREHLEFFLDIKRSTLEGDIRDNHIKRVLRDVRMENHSRIFAEDLPPIMRKKLSIAIALVGHSEVLILDEPTLGLDSDARHYVWRALRYYREKKLILLSTQHMEEADFLGDRIAVMAEGRIVCCGSSIFLNRTLGSAYSLIVNCESTNEDDVMEFIHRFFPHARPKADSRHQRNNKELTVELVSEDLSQDIEPTLYHMLEFITNSRSPQVVSSFRLRCPSIEDIIKNTKKFSLDRMATAASPSDSESSLPAKETNSPSKDQLIREGIDVLVETNRDPNASDFYNQLRILYALFIKQVHFYCSYWISVVLCRVLIPLLALQHFTSIFHYHFVSNSNLVFVVVHYVYFPTMEYLNKFRTIQLASRATPVTYWLSHYITDMIHVVLMTLAANLMIYYNPRLEAENSLVLHSYVTVLFLLFGTSACLIAYVVSKWQINTATSMPVHVIFYMMAILTDILLSFLRLEAINHFRDYVRYFFILLLPTDAVQYGFAHFYQECYLKDVKSPPTCTEVSFSGLYVAIACLIIQILLYGLVLSEAEYLNRIKSKLYVKVPNVRQIILAKITEPPTQTNVGEELQAINQNVLDESEEATNMIKRDADKGNYSLIVSNIKKNIFDRVIVEDLSFLMKQGDSFGLLGINGSGKTSILSMVTGDKNPSSGAIWCNGDYKFTNYRKDIGYLPQMDVKTPLTPRESLYLMARLRLVDGKILDKVVEACLEVFSLKDVANKRTSCLSGGIRKKLGLGMAVIGNPKLLVLDEPTAGIDSVTREYTWLLLRYLLEKKISILLATHRADEVEAVCNRVGIMSEGKLVRVGLLEHVQAVAARQARVKVLARLPKTSEDIPEIISKLYRRMFSVLGDGIEHVDSSFNSSTFYLRYPDAKERGNIMSILRKFKEEHKSFYCVTTDLGLEDVFIKVVKDQYRRREDRVI